MRRWRWKANVRSARGARKEFNRMNKGKIVQVIGPVVDVEFLGALPEIYGALTVEFQVQGQTSKLTLEVQQHLGDN